MKKIFPAVLAGRCANGHERDQGRVVHAVYDMGNSFGDMESTALCGKTHGPRSAGFVSRDDLAITCLKCLKKMQVEPPKE